MSFEGSSALQHDVKVTLSSSSPTSPHHSSSKSLLSLFQEKQKELGPAVLNDSRFDPLLTPFELVWSFGLNVHVPVMNLTSTERKEIFCVTANVGIIYDYCQKKMVFLQGHQNVITSASTDNTGRWIVTSDNGKDNVIIIWDSILRKSTLSIFNHPKPPGKIELVALSPNAKLLVTVCSDEDNEEVVVEFWLWTFGRDAPDETYTCAENQGLPKSIEFHPNFDQNFMMIFEKSVLFFTFNYKKGKLMSKPVLSANSSGGGSYTDGTYVDSCHECFAGNSKGSIVVFGNTLYTQPFNEPFSNSKMRIKSIKVSKTAVTCVKSIEQQIVVGTFSGTIMFFDHRLQILYWLAKRIVNPVASISFKVSSKKYKIEPFAKPGDVLQKTSHDTAGDWDFFEECQDRSDEYEVLFKNTAPTDATLQNKIFLTRDFLLSTPEGMVYLVNPVKDEITPLFTPADSNVAAVDIHSELPYLLIAYQRGRLVLYNYLTHEEVISTIIKKLEPDERLTTVKYSNQCMHLACGTSQGNLWMLQPVLLTAIHAEPMKYGENAIQSIAFTPNGLQMAYYDDRMEVYGLVYTPSTKEWFFKGKVRSHYKPIANLLFADELPYNLYTLGRDRYLIKYNDLTVEHEEIDIETRDRIEQKDIPVYFIPYPKKRFSKINKAGYFLIADDKHKYKIVSNVTSMCTSVFVGPAFNCFHEDPVVKMEFIPERDFEYLLAMNSKYIGIQKMPIDGNPYKFVACLGHPKGLIDFKIGNRGKFVFTFGREDNAVFMWKIKEEAVETMYNLGGEELQPFYCLIEGGKNGLLFREMHDLFYYMQILQQGEKNPLPRVITNSIDLAEIPDLVRACGYYPSEYEIENLLTNARYRQFDESGNIKETISFCEFVKLYVNHKPVYGYSMEQLEIAFDTLTTFTEGYPTGEIGRDDFVEALTTTGEMVSQDQFHRCLSTLLHFEDVYDQEEERDFSFLPPDINLDCFIEEIMGINLDDAINENEESDN